MVKPACDQCSICRKWQRPGKKAKLSSTLRSRFNEEVQLDLFFIGNELKFLHCIDVALRFGLAWKTETKYLHELGKLFTRGWVRYFGPPENITSDQEGAFAHGEWGRWCERHQSERHLLPREDHAWIIERHNDILRRTYLRMKDALNAEGIECDDEDIMAEACYAKNIILNHEGQSPYAGLLGRHPREFANTLDSGASHASDGDSGKSGVMSNTVRIRELALESILDSMVKERFERAKKTNAKPTGELLDLALNELVDIWREPATKAQSG